jgi:hypothetical protein
MKPGILTIYLNENRGLGRNLPKFVIRGNRYLGSFNQRFYALRTQNFPCLLPILEYRDSLKVGLELPGSSFFRPGPVTTEAGRFSAVLTLRHRSNPFKLPKLNFTRPRVE